MKRKEKPIDIDFVILWVDGNDTKWKQEKEKYMPPNKNSVEEKRFRDWGNLQYWFRGVEQFAPWVRMIHFVTCEHIPRWLNVNNKKIHIVYHNEIINERYLPVFNSAAIEINIHKIKGLAEHFVYFNDDIFLTRTVEKGQFFKNGLPCSQCIENILVGEDYKEIFYHTLLNCAFVLNSNFLKRKVIQRYWRKWFSLKYGKKLLKNMLLVCWTKFTSFEFDHLATPFLKSTFGDVWEKERKLMESTTSHKFRTYEDINQYLIRYWQYATGRFSPQKGQLGRAFSCVSEAEELCHAIESQEFYMICMNDNEEVVEFEQYKEKIIIAFNKILPNKSSFEI